MNLEELEALYLKRQSCREFTDKPVSEEVLKEICRVGLLAPSAMNAQPWKLIAVTGEKRKELAKCMQRLGMNKFLSGATAFIVVVAGSGTLLTKLGSVFKENEFLRNDLGILTAHLVLAAEAAGVGSCIIGWRNEKQLRETLGLGKKACIPEVIALGYPPEDYKIREKKRKPFDDVFTLIS